MSAQGLGSRAIIGSFYNRLEITRAASWIPRVSMAIDSNQESETYKWLGMSPAMREWIGGRQAKGLRENGLTIANKTFEGTLRVSKDDIRRDKTGQVQVRINELADRAVTHDQAMLSTLLLNGGSGICYDGQYFFDTDHTEGENSTAQSNLIAFDISDAGTGGTPTNPTARTLERAVLKGIAQLMGLMDDQNEPINELAKEFEVHMGPTLMAPGLAAFSATSLDAGATNVMLAQKEFKVTPVINPRLISMTDSLIVMRSDGSTKPLILQTEEDISVSAIAEGSEHEFKENEHLYGVKKIGNAGYGMWQQACKVTIQA